MIRLPLFCKLFFPNRSQNTCSSVVQQISTYAFPLQFKTSPALWAEPLKKKRKLDHNVIKAKEEKRKKKIMKEIKKLQKLDKQLKPIAEFELPNCLPEESERRKRNIQISEEVAEERVLLLKRWAKIKRTEASSDDKMIKRLMNAQQEALNELRLESEELYQAAVQIDPNLIPFKYKGPTETPPKEDYPFPDGVYIDRTRKWTD